jgi:hypothetical protein
MENINWFELTLQDVPAVKKAIITAVEEGHESALEIKAFFKVLEILFKDDELDAFLADRIENEVKLFGKDKVTVKGFVLQASKDVRYKYSGEAYSFLNTKLKNAETAIKKFKDFAKKLYANETFDHVDLETGEIIRLEATPARQIDKGTIFKFMKS